MVAIKRKSAIEVAGIRGSLSGSIGFLQFGKRGTIKGLSAPIHVKRPNQYKLNK